MQSPYDDRESSENTKMNDYAQYLKDLNNDCLNVRISNLRKLLDLINKGCIRIQKCQEYVNNHVHTFYSFSPFSPTRAVWESHEAGLVVCGIVDHDTIAGAKEFKEAGEILGIATTIGMECRADFSKTFLKDRKINNPDQDGVAYVVLHGIPLSQIDKVQNFLRPYREERNKRNRLMVEKINMFMNPYGINLDFEQDVLPISKFHEGGTVTERHLLFALAKKMVEKIGKGMELIDFLQKKMNLQVSDRNRKHLMEIENPYYLYDVLAVLKSDTSFFYINATNECPDVKDFLEMAEEVGAITAYAYLGDVEDSVTGDKRAQKFEDDYLEDLFELLKDLGFKAITFMPTRNTMKQLMRVKALCRKYDFFEISGEDINSPRQKFACEVYKKKEFKNLIDSAWALVGHEKACELDPKHGMFSSHIISKYPNLLERIEIYKKIGMANRREFHERLLA